MKILPRRNGHPERQALVVEADTGTREICRAALECLGFSVNAVDTGVAAVSAAREKTPDVVVFDTQLRDVGGTELLEWFRGNPALHGVPMIAISALAEHVGTDSIPNGVAGLVRKPVSRAALKDSVRSALGVAGCA